jgi:hypothetical protein
MKTTDFNEMVAFDFSNIKVEQNGEVHCLNGCKSCNCDHCDYEGGGKNCNDR